VENSLDLTQVLVQLLSICVTLDYSFNFSLAVRPKANNIFSFFYIKK
jgi:hypothetical protein